MERVRFGSCIQTQAGEVISVSELNIGKWYDPISERWIKTREVLPVTAGLPSNTEKVVEIRQAERARRIWQLLVDCCADG
jgi:hypothetical protein